MKYSSPAIEYKNTNLKAINSIPFLTINWSDVEKIEHKGETGTSLIQTLHLNNIRIRIVEYSRSYIADRWCQKGHIVHCLKGEFFSILENSDGFVVKKNMSFVVSEGMSSHRVASVSGAKLLIIDGDFLKAS